MKNDYIYIVWQKQNGKERVGMFYSEKEWKDSVLNEFYEANDDTGWEAFEDIEELLDTFGEETIKDFIELHKGSPFEETAKELVECLKSGPVVLLNHSDVLPADEAPTLFDHALEMRTCDLQKYTAMTFDEALEHWEEGNAPRRLIETLKYDGDLIEFDDFRDSIESCEECLELNAPSKLLQQFNQKYETVPLYVTQEEVDDWEDLYSKFEQENV